MKKPSIVAFVTLAIVSSVFTPSSAEKSPDKDRVYTFGMGGWDSNSAAQYKTILLKLVLLILILCVLLTNTNCWAGKNSNHNIQTPSNASNEKPQLVVQKGHSVRAVTFNHDGKLVATGGFDGIVKIWDVNTGKLIRDFHGHEFAINSVIFSHDGKLLASGEGFFSMPAGQSDNTVRIWSVESGELIHTLLDHSGGIKSLAFSPDDKILASASMDKTVKLWSMKDGRLIKTFDGYSRAVYSVAFSPNGKMLASVVSSSSEPEDGKVWEVNTGKLKSQFEPLSQYPIVSYSNNGDLLTPIVSKIFSISATLRGKTPSFLVSREFTCSELLVFPCMLSTDYWLLLILQVFFAKSGLH